jgi:hypothetical protein
MALEMDSNYTNHRWNKTLNLKIQIVVQYIHDKLAWRKSNNFLSSYISLYNYDKLFSIYILLYTLTLRLYMKFSNYHMPYVFMSLYMFPVDSLWEALHGIILRVENLTKGQTVHKYDSR